MNPYASKGAFAYLTEVFALKFFRVRL